MSALDGIDDDDYEGIARACEQMQKEQAAYDKMLALIDSEHKVRSRINDSIDDLQKEMEMIKERRHDFGKASSSAAPTNGPSSSLGRPPLASKSLSKTTSNLMSKLSSKFDEGGDCLPGQPALWTEVPCACGCGEMRKCRSSQAVAPLPRKPTSDASSTPIEKVDGQAQRAYTEKLAKPREKVQDGAMQRSASNSSNRPVDLKRLCELAQPKPPPEIFEIPEPALLEPPRPPPARRSEAEEAALSKIVQSKTGAVGPVMRRPPKRCLSLKSMDTQENPGLANLLRTAEEQHSRVLEVDREARWGPTTRGAEDPEPPLLDSSWRESRVRSLSAQKNYVESRLYPGAASKPGSIEDLSRRLNQLRKERSERGLKLVEGKPQSSKPTRTTSAPSLQGAIRREALADAPGQDRRRLPSRGIRQEQAEGSSRSSKESPPKSALQEEEEQKEICRQERLVEERLKYRRGLDRQIDWSVCA